MQSPRRVVNVEERIRAQVAESAKNAIFGDLPDLFEEGVEETGTEETGVEESGAEGSGAEEVVPKSTPEPPVNPHSKKMEEKFLQRKITHFCNILRVCKLTIQIYDSSILLITTLSNKLDQKLHFETVRGSNNVSPTARYCYWRNAKCQYFTLKKQKVGEKNVSRSFEFPFEWAEEIERAEREGGLVEFLVNVFEDLFILF